MAPSREDASPPPAPRSGLFQDPTLLQPRQGWRRPSVAVGIACLAVVALVAISSLLARKHTGAPPATTVQPAAPYAANLALGGIVMSESTSLSGGKSTYIDGHITNKGASTVTGITVQALFANETGMPPQVDTESLSLIRTREPYIDTQPVSAAPLAPGAEADFRLIFENLNANWNGQQPEIRMIRVAIK